MADEEMLVVEFPHLEEALQLLNGNESNFFDYLSSTSSTDVTMEGLDTINPTCRMGRFEFAGTYEYSLGSRMYFTVDKSESEEKEQKKDDKGAVAKVREREIVYSGLGKKKLVFRLTKLHQQDGDNEEEEDVEASQHIKKGGRGTGGGNAKRKKAQIQEEESDEAKDEDDEPVVASRVSTRRGEAVGRATRKKAQRGGEEEEEEEEEEGPTVAPHASARQKRKL
jgi:hypothetical protein